MSETIEESQRDRGQKASVETWPEPPPGSWRGYLLLSVFLPLSAFSIWTAANFTKQFNSIPVPDGLGSDQTPWFDANRQALWFAPVDRRVEVIEALGERGIFSIAYLDDLRHFRTSKDPKVAEAAERAVRQILKENTVLQRAVREKLNEGKLD